MNIEDLGLEGDQLEFVKKLAESAESNNNNSKEIEGKLNDALESIKKLEANNFDLLNEKKKKEELLRQEREKHLSGDDLEKSIEDRFKRLYESDIEKKDKLIETLTGNALSARKSSDVSALVGLVKSPDVFKLTFSNMVKPLMQEDGTISTVYTDFSGQEVTKDFEAYKKWISEQPQLSDYIIATQAGGSNAAGGDQSVNSGGYDLSKMSKTEISKLANEKPEIYEQLTKKSA